MATDPNAPSLMAEEENPALMPSEKEKPALLPPDESHYKWLVKALADGMVVPFFGAGANLCHRAKDVNWHSEQDQHPPSTGELTKHLAEFGPFPGGEPQDLARVSQYAALEKGLGALYEELHKIFDKSYPPNGLHKFFASLPAVKRAKNYPSTTLPWRQRLVLVTTNYDDTLERAFAAANEKYHLLSYMADMIDVVERSGDPPRAHYAGEFLHWKPEGDPVPIKTANDYEGLSHDNLPVIIKIHGAVDRLSAQIALDQSAQYDSYVITEDHYIDYLTRTDISNLLPRSIVVILKKSHFLFLGYSLQDWNLRVILRRIWREQKLGFKSYAVLLRLGKFDQLYWDTRDVNILTIDLKDYVEQLEHHMKLLEVRRG